MQARINNGMPLKTLKKGMTVLYNQDRLAEVPDGIVDSFKEGDALLVVQKTGQCLHVPKQVRELSQAAVGRAVAAFHDMESVSNEHISDFFERFASLLEDEGIWSAILTANEVDIQKAKDKGRSTTRLVATQKMRAGMIQGLRGQANAPTVRGKVVDDIQHPGWRVQSVQSALGVVGFVFEGRPNVLADATGVLRGGNTVVFRIGRDALGTAISIMDLALRPALRSSGLPEDSVSIIAHEDHSAGWALFSDPRLSLAVARGSGAAVATLGSLAAQSGVPVSLHGTGGAWLITDESTDPDFFESVVQRSLDRKVCNTLNTCCILKDKAAELLPRLFNALSAAAEPQERSFKCHVRAGDEGLIPEDLRTKEVMIHRASGAVKEKQVTLIQSDKLGTEWEWEKSPEITICIVSSFEEALDLCNTHSPQFVASLVSEDPDQHQSFFSKVNAPFVGNGFTRWADGQYALNCPELGLSNWENGRMLARGAILSGNSVYTLRYRMQQEDPSVQR